MSEPQFPMASWTDLLPTDEAGRLDEMVDRLAAEDGPADERGVWPAQLWEVLIDSGATRWSLPRELGGEGCDRTTLIQRMPGRPRGA